MVWTRCTASRTDETVHSDLYQQILKQNVRTSIRKPNLTRKWVTEQGVPKHTSHRRITLMFKNGQVLILIQ